MLVKWKQRDYVVSVCDNDLAFQDITQITLTIKMQEGTKSKSKTLCDLSVEQNTPKFIECA